MRFPLNVYVAAGTGAAIVSYLTLPLWRKWCSRVGLVDEPGHRKIHDDPIPLAGGFAVITGIVIPSLFAALVLLLPGISLPLGSSGLAGPKSNPSYLLEYGLNKRWGEFAAILLGAVGMLVVGVLDDKYELKPAPKFGGQLLIAGLVAASGARITLFVPNVLFHYAVTILWILTVINAFNFMDNMNGLCAGLGAIGSGWFGLFASGESQYLVALIAFLTAGALAGFLPHNFPKAKAFLGDAGSHLVGYLLAVLAILPHFYSSLHPRPLAVLLPLFVLAVPLLDMCWVVVLRWRLGQPFYVGDNNHLSHRLVRKGLSRTQAVLVIWLLACLAGGLAALLI